MLDSAPEPPSSALGDQSEAWNDVFIDDSLNMVISFQQEAMQVDNFLDEPTTTFESEDDDKYHEASMDWMKDDMQPPFQELDSCPSNLCESDISMTSLENLQMFSSSNRLQHRKIVATELLPTLESLDNVQEAIQYILPIFFKVASDDDPSVRGLLVSDIGDIVLYFFRCALLTTTQSSISTHQQQQSHNSCLSSPAAETIPSPMADSTFIMQSTPTSSYPSGLTIPMQAFSFTLIDLLLDQNTAVSSPCQIGVVSIFKGLILGALDGIYGSDGQQQVRNLLDQEIVHGVILELYAMALGRKRRDLQQRTIISASATATPDPTLTSFVDQGEMHLSKVACLSLISALARFLGETCCTEHCLPIIETLSSDGLFYVRKEAIFAARNMMHCIDHSTVIDRLIPLYYLFVEDPTWHIRNTCVLMLPKLCEAVPHEFKCQLVINSINSFMNDSYPIVRFTLAEVLGEVIAKFLPPDWEITGNCGNVPEVIINFFLSLGDNSNHQPTQHHQIENDCTLVCARNFPAVLLTAGASHWDSLFRDKYKRLAKDHQIKVRSSFAHSLHAIAKIIGPVRTLNDLVHIFALYLMDVDEVKSGVMEHLADFLGVLDAKVRSEYLPVLMEIWEGVVTNRAFRKILVDQLALITPLCTLGQFVEHVLSLVLYACQDEVAIIRDSAAKVFPVTLGLIRKEPSGYTYSVDQLITGLHFLMESPLYRQRLLFANIGHLLLSGGLSYQAFVTYLLDRLLVLAEDKVVNVRIAVSRCLATLCSKASQSIESQQRLVTQHEKLNDAIRYLELESDADVAYYMRITVAQMKSMVVGSTLAQHPVLLTPDHFPHQQNQHQPKEILLSELPSPPCSPDGKPSKPTTPLV